MRNSLRSLEGVTEVDVDLDEKIAIVIYEAVKVDSVRMIEATTGVGFPSVIKSKAD